MPPRPIKKNYLDDIRTGPDDYYTTSTPREVIDLLRSGQIDEISLDHDLGQYIPTGYDLAKWMIQENLYPNKGINVHSSNPVGSNNIIHLLKHYAPPHLIITSYKIGKIIK